jgi:outer membrane protein assembly factor BamB
MRGPPEVRSTDEGKGDAGQRSTVTDVLQSGGFFPDFLQLPLILTLREAVSFWHWALKAVLLAATRTHGDSLMRPLLVPLLALTLAPAAVADDWPQWMGPHRDAVWSETGIIDTFPAEGPKVLWRTGIGIGYAGPAVVGNRTFLTDYLTKDNIKDRGDFNRTPVNGTERALCFSADRGELLWKQEWPCRYTIGHPNGPRCTPTVRDGKVYVLGAMGNLLCLDMEKGALLWSKDFPKDYGVKVPLYGFCGHPLVDGKKLICLVGGNGSTAMAFDKDTGKELWRSLSSKETGYCPPTLIEVGGVRQLIIWHGEGIHALDPETGKPYWSYPITSWQAMTIMAPRKDGDYLFAGAVFGSAVGLKLAVDKPAASEAWRSPPNMKGGGLHPMNMTPFAEGGVVYGIDHSGQMRALKIATGEWLWESWLPVTGKAKSGSVYCGTAFLVKNGDRFFLFNEKGELIIARLSPKGYEEVSRARLLEPTSTYGNRDVVWSHPAFANRCVYARNDKELVCVSLAK